MNVLTPAAVAPSNSLISMEEWDVMFFEAHDVQPPTADEANWVYQTRRIASDLDAGRDKWLYVFVANLDDAGQIDRTSLRIEGHYDEEGALSLVNWVPEFDEESGERRGPHAGRDVRPADVPTQGNRVRLMFRVDGSAAENASRVAPPAGGRSVYLAFLSHVQLPAIRLDRYFGEWAHRHLLNRALLLDPSSLTAEGEDGGAKVGYGPTATDAKQEGGHGWVSTVRGTGRPLAKGILIDYLDLAAELHANYQNALIDLHRFDLENADKVLHATVTRGVVEAYAADEGIPPEDTPGRPLDKIETFEGERDVLEAPVRLWSDRLYNYHIELPAFGLARDDAAEAERVSGLSDDRLQTALDELGRQADLLEDAELSEAGRRYLREELAGRWAEHWVRLVSQSVNVLEKATKIPARVFRRAFGDAWKFLRAERLTAQTADDRLASALSQVVTSLEAARAQSGVAAAAAAELDEAGTVLLEAMADLRSSRRRLGTLRDRGASVSDELARARADFRNRLLLPDRAPSRPGFRPLTVDGMVRGSEFVFFEPRSFRPGAQTSFGVEPVRFRVEPVGDEGLVVLRSGGRTAVGTGGLVLPPGEQLRADANRVGALKDELDEIRRQIGVEEAVVRSQEGRASSASANRRAVRKQLAYEQLMEKAKLDELDASAQSAGRATITARDQQAARAGAQASFDAKEVKLSAKGRIAFMLTFVGAGISVYTHVQDRRRRDDGEAWSVHEKAFSSGVGAAGGLLGTVESLDLVWTRAATAVTARTAGGLALKTAGMIGGVCVVIVGALDLERERESHDEVGQVAAGFTIASGVFTALAGGAFLANAAAGLVLALGVVGLVIGIIAALIWIFQNSPLEDWFEACVWGEESSGSELTGAALRRRIESDIEGLLRIIALPLVSVELWDVDGGPARLARYGYLERPVPDALRFVLRPGYRSPGSSFRVSDFRLVTEQAGLIWGDEVSVGVQSAFDLSDPTRVLFVDATEEGKRAAFVHEFDIEEPALPPSAVAVLRRQPRNVEFECTVELVPGRMSDVYGVEDDVGVAVGATGGPPVSFRLRGPVGYWKQAEPSDYQYSPLTPPLAQRRRRTTRLRWPTGRLTPETPPSLPADRPATDLEVAAAARSVRGGKVALGVALGVYTLVVGLGVVAMAGLGEPVARRPRYARGRRGRRSARVDHEGLSGRTGNPGRGPGRGPSRTPRTRDGTVHAPRWSVAGLHPPVVARLHRGRGRRRAVHRRPGPGPERTRRGVRHAMPTRRLPRRSRRAGPLRRARGGAGDAARHRPCVVGARVARVARVQRGLARVPALRVRRPRGRPAQLGSDVGGRRAGVGRRLRSRPAGRRV